MNDSNFKPGDPVKVKNVDAFNTHFKHEGISVYKDQPLTVKNVDTINGFPILSTYDVELVEVKRELSPGNNNQTFINSWFEIDPSRPRPLFKAGDKVVVKPDRRDKWPVSAISASDVMVVQEWRHSMSTTHIYSVRKQGAAPSNVWHIDEFWLDPEPVSELVYKLPIKIKKIKPFLAYGEDGEDDEDGFTKYTNPQTPFLAVHKCRWCREPITRKATGEFKGHWQHVYLQDQYNHTNYWVCARHKTIDKQPHLCEIDLEEEARRGWTAEPNYGVYAVQDIKGRKFKI